MILQVRWPIIGDPQPQDLWQQAQQQLAEHLQQRGLIATGPARIHRELVANIEIQETACMP